MEMDNKKLAMIIGAIVILVVAFLVVRFVLVKEEKGGETSGGLAGTPVKEVKDAFEAPPKDLVPPPLPS